MGPAHTDGPAAGHVDRIDQVDQADQADRAGRADTHLLAAGHVVLGRMA